MLSYIVHIVYQFALSHASGKSLWFLKAFFQLSYTPPCILVLETEREQYDD